MQRGYSVYTGPFGPHNPKNSLRSKMKNNVESVTVVSSEINNSIRKLVESANEAILKENDKLFTQTTLDMLQQAPHISSELYDKLYDIIWDTAYSLGKNTTTRENIARVFYRDCISLCKKFLH